MAYRAFESVAAAGNFTSSGCSTSGMPISSLFLLPKTAALEKVQLMKRLLSQLHWILTTAFLLALFPLFRRAALPLSIDLREIGGACPLGAGVQAAVFCVVL